MLTYVDTQLNSSYVIMFIHATNYKLRLALFKPLKSFKFCLKPTIRAIKSLVREIARKKLG